MGQAVLDEITCAGSGGDGQPGEADLRQRGVHLTENYLTRVSAEIT